MCEFCLKHGEGKKWYLQAENYSDDLLSDIRRRRMIEGFFSQPQDLARDLERVAKLQNAPGIVRNLVRRLAVRKMKQEHYGQVVPIEEVAEILGFVNSVVRVACMCRHLTLGKEQRYCYGISLSPGGGKMAEILKGLGSNFFAGPHNEGLEEISKEEALAAFRDHEHDGLCHTVWTFRAPFIGGICNCDRADCLAMRSTVTYDVPVMFRAEYVAEIDPDKCMGCRQCMRVCQFGAIVYSAADRKASIDQTRCYGCGICRAVCKTDAVRLLDRREAPVASDLW
jgi:ferredoxin